MSRFEVFLFSTDVPFLREAVAGGAAGIVVDWESRGKEERQRCVDTEVNHDTVEDLRRVRAATRATVLCRLNAFGPGTAAELEQAIAAGADEVLLPMVRRRQEPEAVLEQAAGRCDVGILVETVDALAAVEDLARLPLCRVYVGLNDLAIERGSPSIFSAVADGTVERLRRAFAVPFGFAGLTLPEAGSPIPCALLMAEMARLRCGFSFLRRSFRRDVEGRSVRAEVPRILAAVAAAQQGANGARGPLNEAIARAEAAVSRSAP